MNPTDITLLCIFILAYFNGWLKGFLKTILGPVSLIIGSVIAHYMYTHGQNIALALTVGFFGPFVIKIVLGIILKTIIKTFQKEDNEKLSSISRLLGGILSLIWGGSLCLILTLLITFIPLKVASLEKVQNSIKSSYSYQTLSDKLNLDEKDPIKVLSNISEVINNPKKSNKLRESKQYENLMNTDSFKNLMNDPETLAQIENNNITQLLKNPKVRDLISGPNALQKLMEFQKELINTSMGESLNKGEEKTRPNPRVIINEDGVYTNKYN
jgi:membrane protein required for colicin V production